MERLEKLKPGGFLGFNDLLGVIKKNLQMFSLILHKEKLMKGRCKYNTL